MHREAERVNQTLLPAGRKAFNVASLVVIALPQFR